jgi:histidine kinase 2/3/4 (cytokinin receptor)
MNGVIGMTNLLMGTELTAQQLDYVKIAQASGNTLLALINDVLDLSKIEAGKMEIECVQFDIRNEIDIVLSMFDEKVLQKQLEVAALIHDSVPPSLMGDPGRIRQVSQVSSFLDLTC